MKLYYFLILLLLTPNYLAAVETLTRKVSCNKEQTVCLLETNRVTIGDKIAFFNNRGQLIAYGEVKSIRDGKRAVKIEQSYERIGEGFRVTIMNKSAEEYDVPAVLPSRRVDFNIGLGGYNFFSKTTVYEFSGGYEWRDDFWRWSLPKGLGVVLSGIFMTGSKDVGVGALDLPFSMSAIGVLMGASYSAFETYPVSLRTQVNIGGVNVSADVDGDEDYNNPPLDLDIKVEPGFKMLAQIKIAGVYNMGQFNPQAGFYFSTLDRSTGSTIFLGMLMNL